MSQEQTAIWRPHEGSIRGSSRLEFDVSLKQRTNQKERAVLLVTLVNPPALVARFNYSTLSHPPIGLAYIASFLRSRGHDVQIIDAIGAAMERLEHVGWAPGFLAQGLSIEDVVRAMDPASGIIGFSCQFSHSWPLARRLIKATRERFPHAFLVAGGEHATAMAALCLSQAPLDCCVLGEGEATMAELADAVCEGRDIRDVAGIMARLPETGKVVKTAARKRISNVDDLPLPAWDLVDLQPYRFYEGPSSGPTMPMVGSRGCPFGCSFCSSADMWKRTWQGRDPEQIVDEMEQYIQRYGAREFQFFDISPFVDRSWTERLCLEIIERGLSVSWQVPAGVRFDIMDQSLANLLARSGFRNIQYAIESGSQATLSAMNKMVDIDLFMEAVKAALSAGMKVCVLFIIGYPGETMRDIRATWSLIRRLAACGVHEIAMSSFVPLPGTEVFKRLCKEGKIEIDDEFLFNMAGATSLTHAVSWNPPFSGQRLLFLKWLGIAQFYILSFLFYPTRLLRMTRNFIRGVQETKTERATLEIVQKIRFIVWGGRKKGGGGK